MIDPIARQQAIEYRRQLLRIVDQIERDYGLGKHADPVELRAENIYGPEVDITGAFLPVDKPIGK